MDPADAILGFLRHQANTLKEPQQPLEALRTVLINRFNSLSESSDLQLLDEAIDIDRRLLKLYDPLGADYLSKCGDLGDDYFTRFFRTRNQADLSRAVYFRRLIVALRLLFPEAPISREDAVDAASSSIIIAEAAEERSSEAYFDEALSLARAAATVPDQDDLGNNFFIRNVGYVLKKRFDCFGREDDLEEVVVIFRNVAATARIANEKDLGEKLFQFGKALFERWELYRDPNDLKRAMNTIDDILKAPGISDDELRNMLLQYGNRLFQVYNYHPQIKYLDRIDELLGKASEIPTEMRDSRLSLLVARGASYDIRAERSSDATSALAAIRVYEEGLQVAPKDSEVRRILLNNLINSSIRVCIYSRADKDEIKDYLDKVEARLMQDDLLDDSGILLNSARLHFLLYQQDSSGHSALKEAKNRVTKALQINDKVISRMAILAVPILNEYYGLTRKPADFVTAYSLITTVWNSPNESPHVKIQIARDAAKVLYKAGRIREAWDHLKQAVEIIMLACPRNLPRDDQRFIISTLSGLSNDACAVGIAAGGDIHDLLQTLERGRGLAIALSHGASEDLRQLTPDLLQLLENFEDCKSRVYFSNPTTLSDLPKPNTGQPSPEIEKIRKDNQDEFEKLSKEVKKHPELQMILDPPAPNSFQALASEGPIVVVNSSGFRDDVILITESKISTFQLDHNSPLLLQRYGQGVSAEKVARNILELISRGDKGQWKGIWARNKTLQGMLMWLWDYIVNLVCQELELPLISGSPSDIERIWWLPTGFFTQMPFHAAGNYLDGSPREVMINRAISSYISSFRMLKWARSRSMNLSNDSLEGMIVTMAAPKPRRPPSGTIFVRTAKQEADAVKEAAKSISWIQKDKPSVTDVMDELPKRRFMHFCCHGESDPYEPSLSHLKLFKKVVENEDDPRNVDSLTAGSVSTAVSRDSVLAVLSACYTTEIREMSHLDEGLQIANAFQIVGFPHVIGSLWAASDVVCPKWSRKFYSTLDDLIAKIPLSNAHIALAYHLAVVEILNEDPDFAILWAPFVHIGP